MKKILASILVFASLGVLAAPPAIPERDPGAKPWKGSKKPFYTKLEEALDVSFALEQPILLVCTFKDLADGKELLGKVVKNGTWTRDYASKNLVTLVLELEREGGDDAKGKKGGKNHAKNPPKNPNRHGRYPNCEKLKEPERTFVKSIFDPMNNATKWPYSWLYLPYKKGIMKPCMTWKTGSNPGDYYEMVRVQMETLGCPAEFTPALKRIVEAPMSRK